MVSIQMFPQASWGCGKQLHYGCVIPDESTDRFSIVLNAGVVFTEVEILTLDVGGTNQ